MTGARGAEIGESPFRPSDVIDGVAALAACGQRPVGQRGGTVDDCAIERPSPSTFVHARAYRSSYGRSLIRGEV